ncbi:agamous-like MADS-box protein AGL80 [Trifolium pratense]|nr:agamous-like MADS-box protein AGL80 [Trifolium pratense]
MGKKVKLAFITRDTARKATYKKRVKGLMKKLNEITTLCEIKACAIVFNPEDLEPQIWPSIQGVQSVLTQFLHVPEFVRHRKMLNHESYLKEKTQKLNEKLKKQMKENREMKMILQMYHYLEKWNIPEDLSIVDHNDLTYVIDEKMKEINMKMMEMDINDQRV